MNTFHPTQIGYTSTGFAGGSQFYIGRDLTSDWEAAGFGLRGRPDYVERVYINLTEVSGLAEPQRRGHMSIDVNSLSQVLAINPNAPSTGFHFGLREVSICEDGVEKNMMVLASQTYLTGAA